MPGTFWKVIVLPPAYDILIPTGPALTVVNSWSLGKTIPMSDPRADLTNVAVTPDGTKAYASDISEDAVWAIDLVHQSVLAKISIGAVPYGLAITPDGAFAYIANALANTVTVIQTKTNTVAGSLGVGKGPVRVAITPKGIAYVANDEEDSVSIIDTTSRPPALTTSIGTPGVSGDVAISRDGSRAYVAVLNSFLVVDATTQPPNSLSGLSISGFNDAAAVIPDGSQIYVGDNTTKVISIIDASTLKYHQINGFDAQQGRLCIRMDSYGTAYVLAMASDINWHLYLIDVNSEKVYANVNLSIDYIYTQTIALTPS